MFVWKRSAQIPARSSRRKSVLLNLETLETREMLDAGFAGQAASALQHDLARLGNDLERAPITLLNAVQPSSTNTPTAASLASLCNKEANLLLQDCQAVLTDEFNALSPSSLLQAIQQADNRLLQSVEAAFGLLHSPSGWTDGAANAPTAPAVNPPAVSNPILGSTTQASASGTSSRGLPIQERMAPLAVAHTSLPPVFVSEASNLCNCGCPGDEGSLVQPSLPGLSAGPRTMEYNPSRDFATVQNLPYDPNSGPAQETLYPVRYADGVATIATTDLHSSGFGFDWGQTRTWSNGAGYATGSDNGSGWVDTYTPHLIQADGSTSNTLIFLANGNTAFYYD